MTTASEVLKLAETEMPPVETIPPVETGSTAEVISLADGKPLAQGNAPDRNVLRRGPRKRRTG
jgi:hypothetical protein